MRALVVDDSMTMRAILKDILTEMGIEVDCAESGAVALEMTHRVSYGVLLLDWNMPKLLGLDVLKEVRARGSDVPVVMVTTQTEKAKVLEAIKAGANDYLTKPFVKETIVTRVGRLLERRL
jgi:two-component system chemotaxis response regulator CheY